MSFIVDLWQSVLTPGHTPLLVKATHVSFALLIITLIGLLIATRSWHVVFLMIIAACLWASITWFINEIDSIKKQQQNQGSDAAQNVKGVNKPTDEVVEVKKEK